MIETTWNPFFDGWIVAVAAACALACAIPGCLLVLRRQSMMGDALSHAVLPGIAIGFLVTGSRANWIMFTGAIIAALLTVFLTQWLGRRARVDPGAAMGVVFTTLFALGIVLIVRGANSVDLEPHTVLYGALELAPLDLVRVLGFAVPRAFVVLAVVLVANLVVVGLFFKEFRLAIFDPSLASALGLRPGLMHYLLMSLTAVTTVAAFEAVGSIIVVAMLVVPAAAAKLLARSLAGMLAWACGLALVTAVLGHWSAVQIPHWFGLGSVPTSGAMATVAGGLLLGILVLAPREGVVAHQGRRWSFFVRSNCEDLLALAWRLEERGAAGSAGELLQRLRSARGTNRLVLHFCLARLVRRDLLRREGALLGLTDRGREEAGRVVRSHRLWETWLARTAGLASDHVHETAMRLEHVTDEVMRARLASESGGPEVDPHGRPIPGDEAE
ncbi:MAG: metal ABC transporter permease [Planctomycetota bacterium]|nr:metal ABC transporter permease [Planctomycetota bacterium]MEC9158272.1 metal ABC transporter permease [Planctomycetota bacterium]MEC9232669.1 metal ABC transporter permease [Planctomycetota bacterium]